MNVARWLDRTATNWPNAPALYHGPECVADYALFRRRAAGSANWLSAQGVTSGDRVALFMKNCPDYLVVLNGIWMAGAVAVPVNAKLHPKEANWIMDNAGARLAVVSSGLEEGLGAPLDRGYRDHRVRGRLRTPALDHRRSRARRPCLDVLHIWHDRPT